MIYLIVNKENNTYKIGYSNNPIKRINELQTANSSKLTLLFTIKGGKFEEKKIHKLFIEYKQFGEWFTLNEKIYDFFNNYTISLISNCNNREKYTKEFKKWLNKLFYIDENTYTSKVSNIKYIDEEIHYMYSNFYNKDPFKSNVRKVNNKKNE